MQLVTRKDKETFENLLRRFNRKVIQSGTLSIARSKQYFERPISKRDQRDIAIRKNARKEEKIRQQLYKGF